MLKIFAAIALLPIAAAAQAGHLNETHERVSAPGKAAAHYRPIGHAHAPTTNTVCHPESSKGNGCRQIARARTAERAEAALAAAPAEQVVAGSK